jgi:hypothetical protein
MRGILLLAIGSFISCQEAAAAGLITCAEFRQRLAKTPGIFGEAVPRFEFRDWDEINPAIKSPERRDYAIQNVRAIDGQLSCMRKSDIVEHMEMTLRTDDRMTRDNAMAVARFLISMYATTSAYTGWSKEKVKTVIDELTRKAHREAEIKELRGEKNTQGAASYELGDTILLNYWAGGGFGLTFMIDASLWAEGK